MSKPLGAHIKEKEIRSAIWHAGGDLLLTAESLDITLAAVCKLIFKYKICLKRWQGPIRVISHDRD